ncbi:MAG: hypothetical protein KDK12_20975 [Rhodobacteraceae bacterium]|nr:hypothetical protein [Paracoccaceae bacterium]
MTRSPNLALVALLVAALQAAGTVAATAETDAGSAAIDFLAANRAQEAGPIGDSVLASEPVHTMIVEASAYFPQLGAAMIATMRETMATATSAADFAAMQAEIQSLHQPIYQALYQAPDAVLVQLLDDQLALVGAMRQNPSLCARVLTEGYATLAEGERGVTPAMITAVFHHRYGFAAQYMGSAPHRGEVTEADLQAQYEAFRAAGVDEEWLDRIDTFDDRDPQLCQTFHEYLTIVRDADFPGADRLRAVEAILRPVL